MDEAYKKRIQAIFDKEKQQKDEAAIKREAIVQKEKSDRDAFDEVQAELLNQLLKILPRIMLSLGKKLMSLNQMRASTQRKVQYDLASP